MADFTFKTGDTFPAFRVTLLMDGQPANLTNAVVRMRMRPVSGGPLVVNAPMTIIGNPVLGVVQYQWQIGDTAVSGTYHVDIVVTCDGHEQTFPQAGYITVDIGAENVGTVPLPPASDSCWPVDESCCTSFDTYTEPVQVRARALAGQTMRALTGYRVGGCPVTVRPCTPTVCYPMFSPWGNGSFQPALLESGLWVNSCGCRNDCGHLVGFEIVLPGPIGRVDRVVIDGTTLPAAAYRVDNGNRLVRVDGAQWPMVQNMVAPLTAPSTFGITYLRAVPVDSIGAYAAGVLACEFAKACSGAPCRLPSGVTSVTRAGVSMDINSGAFPNGMTGIREVDAYLTRWNPNGLKAGSTVWSPDDPVVRTTT